MATVTKEVGQDDLYQYIKNLFEINDFECLKKPLVVTREKPILIHVLYHQLTARKKLKFEYSKLENALDRLIADRVLGVRIYKFFAADSELPGPTMNDSDFWDAALFLIRE